VVVTIIAVCGLIKEAEIVGTDGVVAVAGGGDAKALAEKLDALHGDISGIISIGLGGALSPHLRVGDIVIGERVIAGPDVFLCDNLWRVTMAARLRAGQQGAVAASNTVVYSVAAKAALFEASGGALAVDMESQVAARFAARRGLRLAVLRVISDDAAHALPSAALVAMKPDGGVALGRVLWSLAKNPLQLPALIRTGRDSSKAFKRLLRCRGLLGPGLGGGLGGLGGVNL
jgi:hopanoid-associated phosphorylase